jgi:alanine racemase
MTAGPERALVTVDLEAVRSNVRRLVDVSGAGVWAVVKADGYGHGAVPVARAALAAGAIGLAVATVDEAHAIRPSLPGARILVLSPVPDGREAELSGLEVAISTADGWSRLQTGAPEGVKAHVKVETGMGRWGLDPAAALAVGRDLAAGRVAGVALAGLMSHLAVADEPADPFTGEQIDAFRAVAATFPPCPRHLANSAGALLHPAARFDEVRCGIAIYGIAPDGSDPAGLGLTPALTLTSVVAALRDLEPGQSAGYGRRLVADRPLRIALVPVGYGDGYPRALSGRADVLVAGRRARVAATVSMDQLTFVLPDDLRDVVAVGDEVVLIGRSGGERVGAEELGALAGTIGYEIVCGLAAGPGRVARRVLP